MDHPNPPTPAHQIAASVGFLYCQIANVNQQPPESPVGGADLSSPARQSEVSYHPTTAAHRSQTKTSPQSHSKSPETRSSNKNASGDQSPNTRINAHDSGPPHPHLAMAVGASTGGGGAAMGRRVHRAAATSRCNPPRTLGNRI